MKLKKGLLRKYRLYLIIDKEICGQRSIINTARTIKKAGCGIIQLRSKKSNKKSILNDAISLSRIFSNTDTIFVINDCLDIAKISGADGVHLGQCDSSLQIARKILGKDKIIGISCHNLKEALRAQKEGADYTYGIKARMQGNRARPFKALHRKNKNTSLCHRRNR